MSDESALRAAIVATVHRLTENGLNQGSSGNVSMRHGAGFLVTPSGVPAEIMTPDQVVTMAMDGAWSGPWKPSSEWRFHRDIFTARPEIGAIVHCHSPAATALAVLSRPLPPFHYMVAMAGGIDVRCAPYATFGTQELSDYAVAALEGRKACLLAHHGMIACGPTLDRALALAVEVEHLCDIYLRLLPLGEPPRLSAEEMAVVVEKFKGYGENAQGSALHPQGGSASLTSLN